jgi:hypothetical protein
MSNHHRGVQRGVLGVLERILIRQRVEKTFARLRVDGGKSLASGREVDEPAAGADRQAAGALVTQRHLPQFPQSRVERVDLLAVDKIEAAVGA